jgi:hypothetical protein
MIPEATTHRALRSLLGTAGAGLLLMTAAGVPYPDSPPATAGALGAASASADTLSDAWVRATLTARHPELLAGSTKHGQIVYIVTDRERRVRSTVLAAMEGVTHARSERSGPAAPVHARPGEVTIMKSRDGQLPVGYVHSGRDIVREIAAREAPLRVLSTANWVTGAVPGGLPVVWVTVGP